MKIAILGAGISGLSCAYALEQYGLKPDIFERRGRIGDPLEYSVIWPRIITRPKEDALAYLKVNYGLKLQPLNKFKRTIYFSPGRSLSVRGNLGYIFKRGQADVSVERQIASQIRTRVNFDEDIRVEELSKRYDKVVVATSNCQTARDMGLWTDTFISQARITTVLGKFNPKTCYIWFNTLYARNAFCYLVPSGIKSAGLVMVVNNIEGRDLDHYWQKFMEVEKIPYYVAETKDTNHVCGLMDTYQKDNIYFIGNAAGLTDDLVGCGGLNAIESGILAARAMTERHDFDSLIQPIKEEIIKLHQLRLVMSQLENKDYDRLLSFMGLPLVKQMLFKNPSFKMSSLASKLPGRHLHKKSF